MTPKHNKTYRERRREDEPNGTPKCGKKRRRRNYGDRRKPCAMTVDHRLDDMADNRLHSKKKRERPKKHRPAGIDGYRQSKRERRRDDGADVGYEAEDCRQDAPKDRAWRADQPQAYPNHRTKGTVQNELSQEKPPEACGRVVERRCGSLEVIGARQPNEPVTKIFALKQNEDDENDDDAGCREGMNERRDQGPQALQRTGIGLAYFHRNGRLGLRGIGTNDRA